jgi:uncharacterized protein YegL
VKKLIMGLSLVLGLSGGVQADGPRIDVAFLLDATGSMADEIDAVKTKIRGIISDIALGEPVPDVRFGLVAYRDRGDEYVTRTAALTRDIDLIDENLQQIQADGGGDYEESLVEGLHVMLNELEWDPAATRLVFLVADAPPHLDYADDYDFDREINDASQRQIVLHAIGASGLDEKGEGLFRDMAERTGGLFQWLVYEQRFIDADGEEVLVRVEGRSATYTRGDSTWTVEGDSPGIGVALGGGRAGSKGDSDSAISGIESGAGFEGGAVESTEVSNNLDDLITDTIRAAAGEDGVEYGGESTAVQPRSWGAVKHLERVDRKE